MADITEACHDGGASSYRSVVPHGVWNLEVVPPCAVLSAHGALRRLEHRVRPSARMGAMDLRRRWVQAGGPDEAFDDIVLRYAEPHRAYHTIHHIEHVLAKVDEIGQGEEPDVVLAAILHDVIYAPGRDDNEDRSADYARRVLADHPQVDRVASLIAATKAHDGPEGDDGLDALLDADLSTFADDNEGKNGELIRQEYAAVPTEAFRAGRRQILQHFLEREPLYRTERMRTRYEAKAKANIRRAIDRIGPDESD